MHIAEHSGPNAPLIALFRDAFTTSDGPTEGETVARLARDLLDLEHAERRVFVADEAGPIGAVFYSPLRFGQATAPVMLLSPMAVATDRQGRGVGLALLDHSMGVLRDAGVAAVMTYGDPAFYGKLGFGAVDPTTVPPPHPLSQPVGWIGRPLTDPHLPRVAGPTRCVPPLDDARLW